MKLNIGSVIRDRRRAMSMTQEQLAEGLGVTCQSVSRWENGATYPDIEYLPILADLFGISLDELMGHTQDAKRQRLSRLWDEGEAIADPEARFAHLARIHEEYPAEWSVVHEMLNLIARHRIRLEELYPLTMAVLENCLNETIRTDVTKIFLYTAEEEAITPEFLERYTRRFDRNTLLETRYRQREDWERYEALRQRNLLYQLFCILDERLGGRASDSAADRAHTQKTAMQILHLLTGYRREASEGVAGPVDTQPDLWFAVKYWIGLRLACALSSLGQAESALEVLEETVTMLENVLHLPIGTVLSHRTRALNRMDHRIVSYSMKGSWCCVELQPTAEEPLLRAADQALFRHSREGLLWCRFAEESRNRIWYVDLCLLEAKEGWEGFDPLRAHPRYLACAERMRAVGAAKMG